MPPSPTTMTSYTTKAGSAQGSETLGDVDEGGVLGRDLPEQGAGGGDVTGPLVEVGQGVPEPQMVGEDPLRVGRRPLEDLDGLLQLPLIGQRPGRDDPPLGHDLGPRRDRPELLPELLHPLVLPERPGDVHEDGMLLRRVGQPDKDVKFLLGGVPLPQPVIRQPQQFPQIDVVREQLPVGAQDPQRLVLVPPVQRPGPPDQRLLEPGPVPHRLRPLPRTGWGRRPALDRLAPPGILGLGSRLASRSLHDPQGRPLPAAPRHAPRAVRPTRLCRLVPPAPAPLGPPTRPEPRFRLRPRPVIPAWRPAPARPSPPARLFTPACTLSPPACTLSLPVRTLTPPPGVLRTVAATPRGVAATPRSPAAIAVGAPRPRAVGALGPPLRIPGVRPTVVHRSPPARRTRVRHRPAIQRAADAQEPC